MKLRIATFNLENLNDEKKKTPTLQQRKAVLRPQIQRMDAHIMCFQEVIGQKIDDSHNDLLALKELLEDTAFKGVDFSNKTMVSTTKKNGQVTLEQNMVIVTRPDSGITITDTKEYNNFWIKKLQYKKIMAEPSEEAEPVTWDRPILYALIEINGNFQLHVINLHLKSKRPDDIPGQKDKEKSTKFDVWKSSAGWAEGFFISSMKRVGQALETRRLIDSLLEDDKDARIVVCGDFNSEPGEVPIDAIRGAVEDTGNPDLKGGEMVSCEMTIPETSRYTYLHYGKKNLLDHMLISKAMLPYYRDSKIHNETLHDESVAFATDTKFPESDHAPFVAEFEIPEL